MHYFKLIGILVLLSGITFSGARPAGAFEPNLDYRYTETFTLGDVILPEGVVISTSDPESSPRGYLLLENSNKEPLFVLSLDYKDVLVLTTPDPGWKTRLNGAHEVASYLVAPNRPAVLGMEALADLDHHVEDLNVLAYELPTENVPLPLLQSSELLLVYDGQVIEVPFTISYAKNSQFDPGIEATQRPMASVESTQNASFTATQQVEATSIRVENNQILELGLLVVIGMFLSGWLIWRRAKRKKQSSIHR